MKNICLKVIGRVGFVVLKVQDRVAVPAQLLAENQRGGECEQGGKVVEVRQRLTQSSEGKWGQTL